MIGTDTLQASLDVSTTLTGDELAVARLPQGYTAIDQEVKWIEWTDGVADENFRMISRQGYSATFKDIVGAGASYFDTVVVQFPGSTTNNVWIDEPTDDAEHTGWHKNGVVPLPQMTEVIALTSVGAAGAITKATPKALRTNSPHVSINQVGLLPAPGLPALAAGGYYRLLSFNSPDGTDATFTAANSTGNGMFAASSPNLVEDAEGNWGLDPATTLNPVFLGGAVTAGAYNGSNQYLVLRPNGGGPAILPSGYSRSAAPAALLSLADGQSVTIAGGDIADGNDLLWLNFREGDETHSFVLAPVSPSSPKLTVSDVSVTEGHSGTANATFTVTLSAAAGSNVTVSYATAGGTATSGTDFTATSGTLTFTPGQTSKTVAVPVTGDITYEPNEDFFLTLALATNAVIADGVGQGTIQNDDGQPTISISDVSQAEGHSGTTQFVFTVTLSNPSWQTITVAFSTANGTATAGQDYTATSGTLTFLPGETTKTIVVLVNGDTNVEGSEDFFVNLGNAANATLLDATGLGIIQNDD